MVMKNLFLISLVCLLLGCGAATTKESSASAEIKGMYNGAFIGSDSFISDGLSSGFSLESENEKGKTLLIKAVESNNLDTAAMLLSKGSSLEERNSTNGKTPIFYCESREMLELLLKKGADVNSSDDTGETLLEYFLKNRPREYSDIILSHGAKVKIQNNNRDMNPAFDFVRDLDTDIIAQMIKNDRSAFESRDSKGNYPIFYATDENTILKLLDLDYDLKATNNDGENVLGEVYLRAASESNIKIVDKIIKKGVDPKYMSYGNDALSLARNHGSNEMINYLKEILK